MPSVASLLQCRIVPAKIAYFLPVATVSALGLRRMDSPRGLHWRGQDSLRKSMSLMMASACAAVVAFCSRRSVSLISRAPVLMRIGAALVFEAASNL